LRILSCITSDLHLPGAAEAVLGEAARLHAGHELAEVVLVGDRTIEPDLAATDGRNLLREAKERARAEGREVVHEEERLWRGPRGAALAAQWLGAVERTRQLHEFAQGLVASGRLPQVVDTGGNDADKERRVRRAGELTGREGLSLLAILTASPAFRQIGGVEQRLAEGVLAIDVPYVGRPSRAEELARWQAEVAEALAAHAGLLAVVFRGHLNSDPALRREPGCAWYEGPFALARRLHPAAELIHVCGHSHKLCPPYRFGDVLVVPVGYGKADATQRLMVVDYTERSAWRLLDFDIATGRLVGEQPVPRATPA
jgi:hypothetical protein